MNSFDLSIYFVADPACCNGRPIADVVMAAVDGGVTMVQYRDKSEDMPTIAANASMLAELLKSRNIPFVVNDYVDVARMAGADGVHLGQGDVDHRVARSVLGFDAIIGKTAFTKAHIEAIDDTVVDYIGTGPFYPTQTDKRKPVLGALKFAELAALRDIPMVGIGGITPENAAAVIVAGADGVAMMRSISEADDVAGAVRAFGEKLKAVA